MAPDNSPNAHAERAETLRRELRHHDHLYHIEYRPETTDAQYDALIGELAELGAAHPELITPDSPTRRVAGRASERFEKREHVAPLRVHVGEVLSTAPRKKVDISCPCPCP